MSIEDKLAKLQLRVLQTAGDDSLTAGQRAQLTQRAELAQGAEQPSSPHRQMSASSRRAACKPPGHTPDSEAALTCSVGVGGGSARKMSVLSRTTSDPSAQQPLLDGDAVSIEAALEAIGHGAVHRRLMLAVFACQTVAFGEPILLASLTSPATWCAMPWAREALVSHIYTLPMWTQVRLWSVS